MPSKIHVVKLSFIFNDKETIISFDSNEPFSSFKLFITKIIGINFTDYDLYYLKNQMKITTLQDGINISDIIGKDSNPVFFIQKSSTKSNFKFVNNY